MGMVRERKGGNPVIEDRRLFFLLREGVVGDRSCQTGGTSSTFLMLVCWANHGLLQPASNITAEPEEFFHTALTLSLVCAAGPLQKLFDDILGILRLAILEAS